MFAYNSMICDLSSTTHHSHTDTIFILFVLALILPSYITQMSPKNSIPILSSNVSLLTATGHIMSNTPTPYSFLNYNPPLCRSNSNVIYSHSHGKCQVYPPTWCSYHTMLSVVSVTVFVTCCVPTISTSNIEAEADC